MQNILGNEKEQHHTWNPVTIEKLKKEGSNLELLHPIENVFYSNEKKPLIELENLLESKGWQILNLSYKAYENNENLWCLIIKIDLIPEVDSINEMTDLCVELSFKFNCDYDGWYTTVMN